MIFLKVKVRKPYKTTRKFNPHPLQKTTNTNTSISFCRKRATSILTQPIKTTSWDASGRSKMQRMNNGKSKTMKTRKVRIARTQTGSKLMATSILMIPKASQAVTSISKMIVTMITEAVVMATTTAMTITTGCNRRRIHTRMPKGTVVVPVRRTMKTRMMKTTTIIIDIRQTIRSQVTTLMHLMMMRMIKWIKKLTIKWTPIHLSQNWGSDRSKSGVIVRWRSRCSFFRKKMQLILKWNWKMTPWANDEIWTQKKFFKWLEEIYSSQHLIQLFESMSVYLFNIYSLKMWLHDKWWVIIPIQTVVPSWSNDD